MIIQTFHSGLARNCMISESKNAVILSKMSFFLFKKGGAHLQYACNICATFQIDCLKTVGEADYTLLPRNCKISKSRNAVILSKMIFFSLKKGGIQLQYI